MLKQFDPAVAYNRLQLLRTILKDPDYIEADHGSVNRPLRAILTHLENGAKPCQSVLVEHLYIDRDYQDEYAVFYSKTFRGYPFRCDRCHFFACPPGDLADLANLSEATITSYLGFTVIRPTDFQHIGRTILKAEMRDEDHEFVHVVGNFKAHIYGQKLPLVASPFIQQDTQVGACAHASLWMLARYMSVKFGYREYLPSEINSYAKQHQAGGRLYPAEMGLCTQQMLDALQGMGLAAISYSHSEITSCGPHIDRAFPTVRNPKTTAQHLQHRRRQAAILADLAYRYIESSLPVIFLTSNHAYLGIGHTYQPNAKATVTIQRVPAFITNNDNRGPYQKVSLFSHEAGCESFLDVEQIIAILPHEVCLRGEDAEVAATRFVEELIIKVPALRNVPGFAEYFKKLEYRTYLIRSVEWQDYLRQNKAIDRGVVCELVKVDYPKFLWITEVSCSDLLASSDRRKRKCLGHVVVDSTAAAEEQGQVLACHFADLLILQDRQGKEEGVFRFFPNSTPFPHRLLTG